MTATLHRQHCQPRHTASQHLRDEQAAMTGTPAAAKATTGGTVTAATAAMTAAPYQIQHLLQLVHLLRLVKLLQLLQLLQALPQPAPIRQC